MELKLPPRIKILEALGCISDKRIKILSENACKIISSTGEREYLVIIENERVYSNDNGTIYRKYVGYPIIAFLMVKGKLPFSKKVSEGLKGIKWKVLNEKYKKYFIVEKIVKNIVKKKGVSENEIDEIINKVFENLKKIKLIFDESLVEKYKEFM